MFFAQREPGEQDPQATDETYIRLFHAAPNAPAVDIYANGAPIARNLSYRNFTLYQTLRAGVYRIDVYRAGRRDTPILTASLTFPGRTIFTIAVAGMLPNITLLPVAEPKQQIPRGRLLIRFSHLSPTAPNVDVTLSNGTVLFRNVRFRETTNYITLPPSTHHFQLKVAGTNNVVLDVPHIVLTPNKIYTIYAIGLPSGQPPLQVVIPLDGSTYINP